MGWACGASATPTPPTGLWLGRAQRRHAPPPAHPSTQPAPLSLSFLPSSAASSWWARM